MILNSPKGFLFSLRRIRGGNDSASFGDSFVDSHVVRADWAVKGGCDWEEEAGFIEREVPEWDMYPPLRFLVVGMSKGDGRPIC